MRKGPDENQTDILCQRSAVIRRSPRAQNENAVTKDLGKHPANSENLRKEKYNCEMNK
jgi:hypothetical protein